ncbi:hypothetical protein V1509DRAFT_627261 [Lipomyces kononenkoae]
MASRRINKNTAVDEPASSIQPSSSDRPRDDVKQSARGTSIQRNASSRESKILSQKPQGGHRPAKKLGVKKLSTGMPSFEEFEKSAIQEAMQTGTPLQGKSAIDTDWLPFGTDSGASNSSYTWEPVLDRSSRSGSTIVDRDAAEAPRLGFGQTHSTPSQLSTDSGRSSTDSSTSMRFDNQRSISSDEYFGRNTLDPDQERECKRRLDDFDNAPAISSDDYFGRSEDSKSYESNDYVERAKDIALRLAANADDEIENVKTYIGQSANKITSAIWNARK